MRRITNAWSALSSEQRLAALAALALLVTMFFPWYGLQSVDRKGEIHSHAINAFGDVSFVEAAIFLVAAGVGALLLARAEDRDFQLPGGDGTIVMIAGGWAALLIFFRVFSRPAGHGYPVSIEWGFFLAFVAAGALTYAGRRMRLFERPDPPVLRTRRREDAPGDPPREPAAAPAAAAPARDEAAGTAPTAETALARRAGDQDVTERVSAGERPPAERGVSTPVAARAHPSAAGSQPPASEPAEEDPQSDPAQARKRQSGRGRYPPAPAGQMSFEDPPPKRD